MSSPLITAGVRKHVENPFRLPREKCAGALVSVKPASNPSLFADRGQFARNE